MGEGHGSEIHELAHMRKQKVVYALAGGATLKQAAELAGLTPAAIFRWRKEDPEFVAMLEDASEIVMETIREEAISNVRQQVKDLGPKALEVLTTSLDSHDPRIQLQAATHVFRLSGVMERGSSQKASLEDKVATARDARSRD